MKQSTQSSRLVATIASFGTAAVFIGHGALAVGHDALWLALFHDSLVRFGLTMELDTITAMMRIVGVIDILIGACFAGVGLGLIMQTRRRWALSKIVVLLFGYAAIMQLATSLAFVIAGNAVTPWLWQTLERSATFVLPLLGLLATLRLRASDT